MTRKKTGNGATSKTVTNSMFNRWFYYYYNYLYSLALQLFEWQGLPDSIDPRFLEMSLHDQGLVGFYEHDSLGYIVATGATSGVNHYNLPTRFQVTSHAINHDHFTVYNYLDEEPTDLNNQNKGVIIWNNDTHTPTLEALYLFAHDLAEIKNTTRINVKAQKTPVLLSANDHTRKSIQSVYDQYEGNGPVIMTHENFDPDSFNVLKTDAPFVADKLNEHKNQVWNEIMTYLGIKNTNQEKRERMITDEANSNDEQIEASGNVFLKSRQEACDRINQLYGLNVSVDFRQSTIDEIKRQTEEGDENG